MSTAGVDTGEVLGLHEVAGDTHAAAEDVVEGHVGGEAAAGQTQHDEDPAVTPLPQGDLPGAAGSGREEEKLGIWKIGSSRMFAEPIELA